MLGALRRHARIAPGLPEDPLAVPLHYVALEPAGPERRDEEPAALEGGVRLRVAVAAEGDEAVEIKIGAALGTLAYVVDFKSGMQAASLADPAGPGQDLGANVLILL